MDKRPGVMLYFELAEALNQLSDEERGKMFSAILAYGQYGVLPQFEGSLGIAWSFVRMKLDRDEERYREVVNKKSYASYCAKAKREKADPLDFDTWLAARCGNKDTPSGSSWDPTAAGSKTISLSVSPSSSASSSSNAWPGAENDFEALRTEKMMLLQDYL